jgi:hypothetical protein
MRFRILFFLSLAVGAYAQVVNDTYIKDLIDGLKSVFPRSGLRISYADSLHTARQTLPPSPARSRRFHQRLKERHSWLPFRRLPKLATNGCSRRRTRYVRLLHVASSVSDGRLVGAGICRCAGGRFPEFYVDGKNPIVSSLPRMSPSAVPNPDYKIPRPSGRHPPFPNPLGPGSRHHGDILLQRNAPFIQVGLLSPVVRHVSQCV